MAPPPLIISHRAEHSRRPLSEPFPSFLPSFFLPLLAFVRARFTSSTSDPFRCSRRCTPPLTLRRERNNVRVSQSVSRPPRGLGGSNGSQYLSLNCCLTRKMNRNSLSVGVSPPPPCVPPHATAPYFRTCNGRVDVLWRARPAASLRAAAPRKITKWGPLFSCSLLFLPFRRANLGRVDSATVEVASQQISIA